MVTSTQCFKKYGDPYLPSTQSKHFIVWLVPEGIRDEFSHVYFSAVGTIGFPKKIFLNKDFKPVLERSLRNVIGRGLSKELKTWDGVFVLRNKRGLKSLSLHCWGIAVDINQAENQLGTFGKLSDEFGQCFIDAGCNWGRNFSSRKDPMHFELAAI